MSASGWGTVGVGVAVLLALPTTARAQAGRKPVAEGNRLYEEGRFDEAHQKYLEALREDPESPLIRFNDGNALYQSQDFQQALQAYREAISSGDPELAGAAWYNLGNALYRGQQLDPALEAYKQALRVDPGDQDAKHNLERVLEQMKEQEQQQDQSPGGQDDQENQDQQDQQQPPSSQQDQDRQEPPSENQRQPDNQNEGQNEQGDQPQDQQPQEGSGQPETRPGEMTPEQAQRLLDAIQEDPGDVNRKTAVSRGRKPRKVW